MKIGLFYATNTGFTEVIANQIIDELSPVNIECCVNIEDRSLTELQGYDILILGIATWDAGDLPYDWNLFYEDLENHDFKGTKVVMFGLGDQFGYPETFLDAMGLVYRKFLGQGAVGGYGFWSTEEYDYADSLAHEGDRFCGLAIDEDNEPELTAERIKRWCKQVKAELSLG